MRCVIVSGQSGSGKTVALHTLEDEGFYCVDNLPISLIPDLIERISTTHAELHQNVAIGVDARSSDADSLLHFPDIIGRVRSRVDSLQVVFLQTDLDTLVRRFNETRRRHPMTRQDRPLVQAIHEERRVLEPISQLADAFIDTTTTNLHQLRQHVRDRIVKNRGDGMSILFQSFGYKHGTPLDTDFAFDIRCLPNPHWQVNLRPLDGRDKPIIDFLEEHSSVGDMYGSIEQFLHRFVPDFESEGRAYLTISIGCTGGRHRSVYMVEKLAAAFRKSGHTVSVRHREIH
ncbi:MAG: RNase adapter RapZ [Pseudomonadota bacterium]